MNDGLKTAAATAPALERKEVTPADRERAGARKVAREFEAMFVGMMLKSMRSTVPESSLTGGNAEKIYRDMLDQEYASAIAARGGLGLSEVLESQLIRQNQVRSAGSTGGGQGNDE